MDPRKAMFAACKKLGMSDDDRHAMLVTVTGQPSSKNLSPAEWRRVLDHLNRKTGHAGAGPSAWRPGCEALGRKITALLAAQRLPWRYLTHGAKDPATGQPRPSMLRRLAGVDRLEFADAEGLRAVVAALSRRQEKVGSGKLGVGTPTPHHPLPTPHSPCR